MTATAEAFVQGCGRAQQGKGARAGLTMDLPLTIQFICAHHPDTAASNFNPHQHSRSTSPSATGKNERGLILLGMNDDGREFDAINLIVDWFPACLAGRGHWLCGPTLFSVP